MPINLTMTKEIVFQWPSPVWFHLLLSVDGIEFKDVELEFFHNRSSNRYNRLKTGHHSVCAVANYDVVIIKWCLKTGIVSFILRHIVLYVAAAIKGRRRHRRHGHLHWQLPLTAAAGAVADIKHAGLQGPVSDSGWDVGGVGLKLCPCSAPVGL